MASIVFNDGAAATLTNGKPAPADQFANWVPNSRPVGDAAFALGNGAMTRVLLREDHSASFELRNIPIATVGGVRMVEVANRLILHLLKAGTCTVNTGDTSSSSYATCGLLPGSSPSLVLSDPRVLEYTLSLALLNLAASPVAMVCRYRSVTGT